jgi:hypothetical protein
MPLVEGEQAIEALGPARPDEALPLLHSVSLFRNADHADHSKQTPMSEWS